MTFRFYEKSLITFEWFAQIFRDDTSISDDNFERKDIIIQIYCALILQVLA